MHQVWHSAFSPLAPAEALQPVFGAARLHQLEQVYPAPNPTTPEPSAHIVCPGTKGPLLQMSIPARPCFVLPAEGDFKELLK